MRLTPPGLSNKLQVFTALRHRAFRLYWLGHMIAVSGAQIVIVAQGWLVWELTQSEFLLGLLGLITAVPAVLLTLFGGAVADKVELRRLLVVLESVSAAALLVLATLSATSLVRVWHIVVVAFLSGIVQAFDHPARQALFPHLLDRGDLMNAVSLNSMIWPGTRIFGPALAGIIIASVGAATDSTLIGTAAAFYLAALAYGLFALFVFLIKIPSFERARGGNVLENIVNGVRFVWKHSLFKFLIGMNYLDIFLLVSHMTLLPVFASEVFAGDASTLGVLYTMSGIGSLMGALVAANLGHFPKRGWLILGGAGFQAFFLMLFGFSGWYAVSLVLLPLAGVGLSFFMVASQSTVQYLLPDDFRGRVMAIWGMNYSVVYPLGQLQMGTVAGVSRTYLSGFLGSLAGAPSAVILGAMGMLMFTLWGFVSNRQMRNLGPEG